MKTKRSSHCKRILLARNLFVFAGSHDGFLSHQTATQLGSDVTRCALKIANPVNVTVGTLVGVRRSDGRVTVARVDPALSTTPPGFVHITLTSDGSWKDVPSRNLKAWSS